MRHAMISDEVSNKLTPSSELLADRGFWARVARLRTKETRFGRFYWGGDALTGGRHGPRSGCGDVLLCCVSVLSRISNSD